MAGGSSSAPPKPGLVFWGRVSTVVSATQFTCDILRGKGDGFFQDWAVYVVRDAAGGGVAPQGEQLNCTAYVSATGLFTTPAFAVALVPGDEIYVLHPDIASGAFGRGQEAEAQAAALNLNGGVATSGLAGADVYTITVTGRAEVMCGLVSMRNCTPAATITVRMYTLVNGVDEQIYTQNFTQGVDPNGITPLNGHFGINENLRFEMFSNNAADVAVNVPYKMIWRRLE